MNKVLSLNSYELEVLYLSLYKQELDINKLKEQKPQEFFSTIKRLKALIKQKLKGAEMKLKENEEKFVLTETELTNLILGVIEATIEDCEIEGHECGIQGCEHFATTTESTEKGIVDWALKKVREKDLE